MKKHKKEWGLRRHLEGGWILYKKGIHHGTKDKAKIWGEGLAYKILSLLNKKED